MKATSVSLHGLHQFRVGKISAIGRNLSHASVGVMDHYCVLYDGFIPIEGTDSR